MKAYELEFCDRPTCTLCRKEARELAAENERLREALEMIADIESTDGYLRDIRGGNAAIARKALDV